MHKKLLDKIAELQNQRQSYSLAQIVRRKIPSSGKPGDKAIITADGHIFGWIGGGCTRGIVLKESLAALKDGKPRFVHIGDEPSSFPSTKTYHMTCHSGGTVEVYIEPNLPKPQIVILGRSHIGMALARISKAANFNVLAANIRPDKIEFETADTLIPLNDFNTSFITENTYITVCTQGEGDEDALEAAIKSGCKNIAFVASMKKANAIFRVLRQRGISFDQLKHIKTPAGLDIQAKLPEEVAISILAEVIQDIRKPNAEENISEHVQLGDDYYLNPVCKIPIQKSTAKHVLEYNNEKVYFCCDGCKVSFEKTPGAYV